jgi:hypothetical protein
MRQSIWNDRNEKTAGTTIVAFLAMMEWTVLALFISRDRTLIRTRKTAVHAKDRNSR